MTDDRFDDFLQDAARGYNQPPPTPREEVWARIEAARRAGAPRVLALRPRRRWLLVGAPLGLAATLLIGIAIGRLSQPAADPGVTAGAESPGRGTASLAVQLAAAEHLSRVEALLVDYSSGRDANDVGAAARDLLTRTRLWIDSDRIRDPRLRALLEDLELVLVQIAQLAPGTTPEERTIIDRGISELKIRPRLLNALPAGPTA